MPFLPVSVRAASRLCGQGEGEATRIRPLALIALLQSSAHKSQGNGNSEYSLRFLLRPRDPHTRSLTSSSSSLLAEQPTGNRRAIDLRRKDRLGRLDARSVERPGTVQHQPTGRARQHRSVSLVLRVDRGGGASVQSRTRGEGSMAQADCDGTVLATAANPGPS